MKHITLAAILAATSALQAVEHKLPAPMPEFKTPEQLAKWREEKAKAAAAADSASTIRDSQFFYTGKPFIAETGSYAFLFRNYNPELSRWTTIDPSGFPNGANNFLYVSNNTPSTFDMYGLFDAGMFTKGAAQFTGGIGLIVGGTTLLAGSEAVLPGVIGVTSILTGVFTMNSGILNMGSAWSNQTTWIPTTTSGMVTTTLSLMVNQSMTQAEYLGSWADTFENATWAMVPGASSLSANLRRASSSLNLIAGQINTHRDFIPATNANGEQKYE